MQNNSLSQNKQTVRYCLECSAEMDGFFLPLYDFENQFCERCEIDDYEGNCHCNERQSSLQ